MKCHLSLLVVLSLFGKSKIIYVLTLRYEKLLMLVVEVALFKVSLNRIYFFFLGPQSFLIK